LDDLYIWAVKDETFDIGTNCYPTSIPKNRQLVTLLLRDVQQKWPDGFYHVFYDGEGVIEFGFDASIVENREKGRMKILVKSTLIRDNGIFMKIKKTNPQNPLRNIRVVMDGYEKIYQSNPFHSLFLERLSIFKTIRFMPWNAEKDMVKWEDRIQPATFTKGRGVAYEYQIMLSNFLKTNPWIHIPYGADDEFIMELAKLLKATLRKDVQLFIEYSNEAWNTLFESGKYCEKMGLQLGLDSDKLRARNKFYSRRVRQIVEIFKSVFENEDNRFTMVIGTFTVMPQVSSNILSFENLTDSHKNLMLAVTGYFSCGDVSASQVAISSIDALYARCGPEVLNNDRKVLEMHQSIANKYNVTFGMYESGASFMEYQAIVSGGETPGATEKYIAFNRDPRIYNLYLDYYTMFNTFNLSENCHYAFVETPSKYGSWYLLEYQNQDLASAHRYRAISDVIESTRNDVELWCNGMNEKDEMVCGGHGICLKGDVCKCQEGYYGAYCDPTISIVVGSEVLNHAAIVCQYLSFLWWLSLWILFYQ